jgi:hypothetical protein
MMPEKKIVDHEPEDRWLVLYWHTSLAEWVLVQGRQFASEQLARDVHAEYCRVMGPEKARILRTADSHAYTGPTS